MNRPRDSVLHLFDPLNSLPPPTPRRDVTTPDSDKENSAPQSHEQLTLSTFFSRNYRVHHKDYGPATQKGLLVDVTMADGAFHSLEGSSLEKPAPDEGTSTDEISLNDSEDEAANTVARLFTTPGSPLTPVLSSPRTPLADIALQIDTTIVARKKVYTRDILSMRGAAPSGTASSLDVPQDVPLASAVNDVNFSGASSTPGSMDSIPNTQPVEPWIPNATVPARIHPEGESTEMALSPPINLSTSVSSTLSGSFLGSSTATLLTDTAIPLSVSPPSPTTHQSQNNDLACSFPTTLSSSLEMHAQTRLRPQKTSFLDPRPVSVDLQSSFIQCPETSFDLLNDTVSFFGVGRKGASIMDADEDSFDMSMRGRDTEMNPMEEMVKKFRKVELGNKRNGTAGPAKAMPTISESLNNTPEVKPKGVHQTSSSNEATPRASDGITTNRWALNPKPCSPDSPTVTFGQGFPKRIPPNDLPSHTSICSPEAPGATESNERTLASPTSPSPAIPTFAAPVFVPPPPRTPSPPRTPPRTIPIYAAVAPVPVPALRIVKRKGHERTGSSVSSSSGEEKPVTALPKAGGVAARRLSVARALPLTQEHASGSVRGGSSSGRVSTGLGALAGPGRSIMPSRMAAPSTSAAGPVRYVGGPIRVPIGEKSAAEVPLRGAGAGAARYGAKAGVQKSSLGSGISGSGSGARRVPVTAQQVPAKVHVAPTAGAAGVSGLRMPVRYGGAAGGTALPRPVSRLPAPSGPGKVKKVGGARRGGGYGL